MTKISIAELSALNPQDGEWASTLAKRPGIYEAFLIKFSDPSFLAGPFADHYGLVTIYNAHKSSRDLLTETEEFNNFVERTSSSIHLFPADQIAQSGYLRTKEYITGRYSKSTNQPAPSDQHKGTNFFFTHNSRPESETLKHPHLEFAKCTSSNLTGQEFLALMQHLLKSKPASEVLRIVEEAQTKINLAIDAYLKTTITSTPTREKPVVLHLCGNDDSSWTKVFATLREAQDFAKLIESNDSSKFILEQMDFTN